MIEEVMATWDESWSTLKKWDVIHESDSESLFQSLVTTLEAGDIVVTLGAGDISGFGGKLLDRLRAGKESVGCT